MDNKPSFVFFGSPWQAVVLLKHLTQHFQPALVITQPDKPAGRGQTTAPTPIAQAAEQLNIPTIKPARLNQKTLQTLQQLNPRPAFGFLFAYAKIIPKPILDFFPKGIINLHPSLLPAYRGPSPVRQALLDCQKTTGFSLIKLDEQMDHGPIIYQQSVPILADDTHQTLLDKIIKASLANLAPIINQYLTGQIHPKPQNHSQATYTKRTTKKDGLINWALPDQQLDCFIRAMTPWPGAWTFIKLNNIKKRLKILKAHLDSGQKLQIDIVQLEGKKPVTWKQFLSGYPQAEILK
ncbi:MAG: methionyl-tRNA formyltransferase [bacterium]|nr:methionyl-tRNA formyltransferase [bacterium]